MENRLLEVNLLANQSQLQLNDTTNVIKSLEERLKTTEVCFPLLILRSEMLPYSDLLLGHLRFPFRSNWLLPKNIINYYPGCSKSFASVGLVKNLLFKLLRHPFKGAQTTEVNHAVFIRVFFLIVWICFFGAM